MSSSKLKKQPTDTAWPPTGVRDLKPDISINDRADHVRFPTLRDALERAAHQLVSPAQVSPGALTEQLVLQAPPDAKSRRRVPLRAANTKKRAQWESE